MSRKGDSGREDGRSKSVTHGCDSRGGEVCADCMGFGDGEPEAAASRRTRAGTVSATDLRALREDGGDPPLSPLVPEGRRDEATDAIRAAYLAARGYPGVE